MADEESDSKTPPAGPTPAKPLDYFTAHAPDPVARPGSPLAWTTLASGWLPYLCGIANAQATVRSGVQDIIDAHHNAAVLFSALGLVAMFISLILFVRCRDGLGFLVALLSVMIAAGTTSCLVFPSLAR